jgi:hypothetical protein
VNAQAPLTSVAADVQLGSAPFTVDLVPEPALATAAHAGGNVLLVLVVEGLAGTTVQPVRVNVFLGKPDADRHTPTDDPGFVGFIQLLPVRGTVGPVGHAFQLTDLHRRQLNRPIRISLVPVVGDNGVPSDVFLRISRIYLRREA